MGKKLSKSIALAMVLMTAFVMLFATAAFAANETVPGTFSQGDSKITGNIDLTKTVRVTGKDVITAEGLVYRGTIIGKVEASDLFEDAYSKYIADIKGQSTKGAQWDHIVMCNKGTKFPTADLTVKFPSNFVVNKSDITVKENTVMTSSNTFDVKNNTCTFVFNLGNWNDYEGFFKLYESEKGTTGHAIEIEIPFEVKVTDTSVHNLGQVTTSGKCELYKKFLRVFDFNIVDVTATADALNIVR